VALTNIMFVAFFHLPPWRWILSKHPEGRQPADLVFRNAQELAAELAELKR
jgi:hypothetical protein